VNVPVVVCEGRAQTREVPLDERTCPAVPTAVRPVPPDAVGRAVPERVIASVPDEVIGEPASARNDGTDAATEVTVPVVGVCQTRDVPFEVRTWFTVPTSVRPVPPEVVGRAVPERVIASVPDVVIGEPASARNDGTDAATEVTVPVPVRVCHTRDVPFEASTWFNSPTVLRPVPPDEVPNGVPRESEPVAGIETIPVPATRNSSVLVVVDVPA